MCKVIFEEFVIVEFLEFVCLGGSEVGVGAGRRGNADRDPDVSIS